MPAFDIQGRLPTGNGLFSYNQGFRLSQTAWSGRLTRRLIGLLNATEQIVPPGEAPVMPIYAYRCSECGHQEDALQKMSAAPLTICTACGAAAFARQLTAPAFQLKGSGWYVTDFRDNGKKGDAAAGKTADSAGGDSAGGDSAGGASGDKGKPANGGGSASESGSGTAASPAPASGAAAGTDKKAAAPAPSPASGAQGSA